MEKITTSRCLAPFVAFVFWALVQDLSYGAIIFVKEGIPDTQGTGTSWETACSFGKAVSLVKAGDAIWLKRGNFSPAGDSKPKAYSLPAGTHILGGFSGTESDANARQEGSTSTFDGMNNVDGLFTIQDAILPVEMERVVIRGARRGDSSIRGAIHVQKSELVIRNCTIEDNSTTGLYCSNGKVTVSDCIFRKNKGAGIEVLFSQSEISSVLRTLLIENSSDGQGAGISSYESILNVLDSTFTKNHAGSIGGGICIDRGKVSIRKCIFTQNSAGDGGGIGITQRAKASISLSVVSDNVARIYGGGAYTDALSTANFVNCAFIRNLAADKGGGSMISYIDPDGLVSFANCIFVENRAGMGGGIATLGEASPTLINCTILGNVSTQSRAGGIVVFGGRPSVRNSIITGNTPDDFLKEQITLEPDARIQISDCVVDGGFRAVTSIYDGSINFWDSSRPLGPDGILGTMDDGLRLQPGSAAIDRGRSDWLPADMTDINQNGLVAETLPLDLQGLTRTTGSSVDIGAYEFDGVQDAPIITLQPIDQSIDITNSFNTRATIQVAATGQGLLQFQWFKDGIPLMGETNSKVVFFPLSPAHSGDYEVIIADSQGKIRSNPGMLLAVPQVPEVVIPPRTVCGTPEGLSVTLFSRIEGSQPLSFQWFKDGLALPGESNSFLRIHYATLVDAGAYYLTASNHFGVVASPIAQFRVRARAMAGRLITWGDNLEGQLNIPIGATNIVQISAGSRHSLALRSDGVVFGWGANESGQAAPPPSATNVVAVAAGFNHSLALTRDGNIISWGDVGGAKTPPPLGTTNVVAIYASGYSYAIHLDGKVTSWGYIGGEAPLQGLSNVVQISGAYAVQNDGNILAWGARIPVGLGPVREISSRNGDTLAVLTSGDLVFWDQKNPVRTVFSPSDTPYSPRQGNRFRVVLLPDGSLWGEGSNLVGQLDFPMAARGLERVLKID